MSSTASKILSSIGLCLLAIYICWAMMMPDSRYSNTCGEVRVYLTDSVSRQFVCTNEILSMMRQNDLMPNGIQVNKLNTEAIEKLIASHNLLRKVVCFTSPNGDIILKLSQRIPKYRVIGENGDYFVDIERFPMKVTTRTASYVPIVTGNISQELATGEMFDFVSYIEDDSFWSVQIEQIIVNNKVVKLIPRVGAHTIIMGGLDNYERKLAKLEKLYTDGFSEQLGWRDYKEIDLRYEGQIVCR